MTLGNVINRAFWRVSNRSGTCIIDVIFENDNEHEFFLPHGFSAGTDPPHEMLPTFFLTSHGSGYIRLV